MGVGTNGDLRARSGATRRGRRNATIVASLARSLVDSATAAGLDRDELLGVVGANDDRPADGRVPHESYVRLWGHVSARVRDPFFGLRLARAAVDARSFSVVRVAARSGSTFGAALARIVRYRRVLGEDTDTRLEVVGRRAVLSDGLRDRAGRRPAAPDPVRRWPRQRAECVLASYVVLGRRWTGTDWVPLEVRFQHARPPDTSFHESLFGCPIRFGRPLNQIVFDARHLALPIRDAEPQLRDLLERRVPIDESPGAASSIAEDVRRIVANALPGGAPSIDDVARRLGTSARTLERHLRADGLSLAGVVADVRRDLATRLLREGHASLAEIGFLLGFGETAQFRRAFTRWTGRAPSRWLESVAG